MIHIHKPKYNYITHEVPKVIITPNMLIKISEKLTNITDITGLFDKIKENKLNAIPKLVEDYIYKYYSSGTQKSLLKLISTGNDSQKQAVTEIFNWIDSVMAYYYSKKDSIRNATTIADIYTEIDFSSFDSSKPSYTLEDIYKLT